MLQLPPLYPITDARLDESPSDQILRLGVAGFPLVRFDGGSLGERFQREELARALATSAENGGWPVIGMDDQAGLGLEGRILSGLVLGTSLHEAEDWNSIASARDHVGLGPFLDPGDRARSIGFEGLRRGCALLRQKERLPFAFGGLTLEDAEGCYQAGAESLAMTQEILCSPTPSELLWKAQCLRWRIRPPVQAGQGVALIGGSGCGKSTLARKLGSHLQLPVQDLDETIVQRAGKSISQIFAEEGEPAFRTLEREVTCEAFQSRAILALGGGAWESETIRKAAQASGYAVLWIAENPDRIWRRVARDPARPLASQRTTFLARWRSRMARWMEAPMILPLGRTPRQLADALSACSHS